MWCFLVLDTHVHFSFPRNAGILCTIFGWNWFVFLCILVSFFFFCFYLFLKIWTKFLFDFLQRRVLLWHLKNSSWLLGVRFTGTSAAHFFPLNTSYLQIKVSSLLWIIAPRALNTIAPWVLSPSRLQLCQQQQNSLVWIAALSLCVWTVLSPPVRQLVGCLSCDASPPFSRCYAACVSRRPLMGCDALSSSSAHPVLVLQEHVVLEQHLL